MTRPANEEPKSFNDQLDALIASGSTALKIERRVYRIDRITARDAMVRLFRVECVYGSRVVEVVYYKSYALAKRCAERWVEHGC